MALSLTRPGDYRFTQAYELVTHNDNTQELRFLLPEKAVQLFDPAMPFPVRSPHVKPYSQLADLFQNNNLDPRDLFPKESPAYISFAIRYDQNMNQVSAGFGETSVHVTKMSYEQCDAVGRADIDHPVKSEIARLQEWTHKIYARDGFPVSKGAKAETLAKAQAHETNIALTGYMRDHNLYGLVRDKAEPNELINISSIKPPQKLHLAAKGERCLFTAYASVAEQFLNMAQCLCYHKNGQAFLKKEFCRNVAQTVNDLDLIQYNRQMEQRQAKMVSVPLNADLPWKNTSRLHF